MPIGNRRVVLAAYMDGLPKPEDFRIEEADIPVPDAGEVLVENVFVSVDTGMRGRVSGQASYAAAVPIGGLLGGPAVGRVVETRNAAFATGDWVTGQLGWQLYGIGDSAGLRKIGDLRVPPSAQIGVLGVSGLTAFFGLAEIGKPQPGEAVLVSSAAGAVGSAAGQIARIGGARVVGIAGGPDKCRWLVEQLGFTDAIDRHAERDIAAAVNRRFPDGVDILFDNVGTTLIDPVLPLMRRHGRIVVAGRLADFHIADDARQGLKNTGAFITARLKMQGFIVSDHAADFPEARRTLTDWVVDGRLRYREDIEHGIESLPAAFIGMFEGHSIGRKLARLTAD